MDFDNPADYIRQVADSEDNPADIAAIAAVDSDAGNYTEHSDWAGPVDLAATFVPDKAADNYPSENFDLAGNQNSSSVDSFDSRMDYSAFASHSSALAAEVSAAYFDKERLH